MKRFTFAVLTIAAVLMGAIPASAANTLTVCADGTCGFTTIQAAVNAASAGDTITVSGPLNVAGQTTINKDVTVQGQPGAKVTQTATAITFLLSGAGSTLTGLEITSDTPKAREFVQIGGNDVTLSNNTIYGPEQSLPMSDWVGNRGFVTQGGITGFLAEGNTLHSMRSGAYLNPNGSGAINNNTVSNTKGDFLIDNANFTFDNNQVGDEGVSEWGFVIFPNTAADRYADLGALTAANDYMTGWDQRDGEQIPDSDGDGTNNLGDTDDDNDGASDEDDLYPLDPTESGDADEDGIANNADTDDDNDGVLDVNDASPTLSGPQNANECKNNVWKDYTAPRTYKNQGACVSSVSGK